MKIAITGTGVLSPIGIGVQAFCQNLRAGQSNFSILELEHLGKTYSYPSALIEDFDYKKKLSQLELPTLVEKKAKRLRNISTSIQHGVYTALEAWQNAGLFQHLPHSDRVAIVVSGSNTQQATSLHLQERYREKLRFMKPTYGFSFLDTDLVGVLSELLNIKGEGHTIGAASASGNMAILQGYRLIESGDYDIVLVVAPSMELSIYEYQGFTALGAMAVLTDDKKIENLCNPFDKNHCGFVYGQNAGALILEAKSHAEKRKATVPTYIVGYGVSLDSNRNPNPSVVGEAKAMQNALNKANLTIEQIEYINTHGTASTIGDITELEAILSIGGKDLKANATKGLIGHGITAAGLIEAIACILQMQENFLHPNPNLKKPISKALTWIKEKEIAVELSYCMNNSYGFGGINTATIFQKNIKTNN